MDDVLTNHAKKRCASRKIDQAWIQAALDRPVRIEADPHDHTLMHVLYPVPERAFRTLRVIYNESVDPALVVTAYFDTTVTDL
jgi:hypothetical protein